MALGLVGTAGVAATKLRGGEGVADTVLAGAASGGAEACCWLLVAGGVCESKYERSCAQLSATKAARMPQMHKSQAARIVFLRNAKTAIPHYTWTAR